MNREKEWMNISALMFTLNFCILFYYSVVCLATVFRICGSFGAYSFLSSVRQVPQNPWKMPLYSALFYGLLVFVSFGKYHWKPARSWYRLFVCAAEILLCVGTIVSTNFYYSGVALAVLADLVHYARKNQTRILVMTVLMLIFAFGRYETAFFFTSRIPFSAYLSYYRQSVQGWLAGIESVIVSFNVLLFAYSMILLFTGQKEETLRISRLNEQLHRANGQLRKNAVELERLAEIRERNRLAREIHDTLGHTLTGIIMGLEAVLVIFDTAPEEAKKRVAAIVQTAREGLNDVRGSIKALRPDALEKHSLEDALNTLTANFHLTTSAEVRFEQKAGPLSFAGDEEDTLYRIVQEGMTNAVRHGHATEIEIEITREDDVLTVMLRDNGLGCENLKEGFGLRHMEERLGLLGGSLSCGNRNVDSDDGNRGFYLLASLPVRGREQGDNE